MAPVGLIEQELAAAEAAWRIGNDGKARVCARRAVAAASDQWLARHSVQAPRMDAMGHLRGIQADQSVPVFIRQAAERLTTAVTRRDSGRFTVDPIGDARLIIAYLVAR